MGGTRQDCLCGDRSHERIGHYSELLRLVSFTTLVHPDMQKELDKWYADDMLEVDTESEETDAKLPDDYGDGSGYNGFWDSPDPDA